ncbi:MAG: UDP-N-acetylglucosamine 2-epimerase (non-hydrolyzing) [Deltaproteobacteria bacterium]|nr:MAG: UDP-N-acetylglucosamine 2-epimerase (non-hydrolyzing) [Deltaproteobacteria bacterium]
MKVMTILGTRPEIIKLSRVIAELDRHVDHVLVHTGQNFDYELNEIFFKDLGIRKPDHFLEVAGGTPAETIGNVIIRADAVMEREKPDAFLILGDTNSCLSAIPAKRRKIPIFHMEAGNRCFDQRVPEEVNRKIIDHVSDINLTYTEHARRYLLREGLRPETVIKTGSPMREVIEHYRHGIDGSDVLSKLALSSGEYYVVSAHREENVDDETHFGDLIGTLKALAEADGRPVVVSTHPRTRKRLQERGVAMDDPRIRFLNPLGFLEYVKLQQNARCVLSDSGTITEESSILGFPAVTIRQAHERPEGMDEGTLIMCGLKPEHVLNAVGVVVAQAREGDVPFRPVPDYEPRNVSKKVVRIILSYVEYVNRTVWFRLS